MRICQEHFILQKSMTQCYPHAVAWQKPPGGHSCMTSSCQQGVRQMLQQEDRMQPVQSGTWESQQAAW
jgi:hypothetical protein